MEINCSYEQSETLKAFLPAFLAAQSTMEALEKNKVNEFHHNNYADLAQVLNVVRPVLNANGIMIMFFPCNGEGGKIGVHTRLMHVSGEYMANTITCPLTKQDPQGVGIALTYLRRYGLTALVGLAQEDKDGNMGDDKPKSQQKPPYQSQQKTTYPAKNNQQKPPEKPKEIVESALVKQEKIKISALKDQPEFLRYFDTLASVKPLCKEGDVKIIWAAYKLKGEEFNLIWDHANNTFTTFYPDAVPGQTQQAATH